MPILAEVYRFLSLYIYFVLFWFFWKDRASLELVLLSYKSNVWFKKHLSQVNRLDKVLRENDACGEVAGKANTAAILSQQETHLPPWPVRLRFALPDELDFPEIKQHETTHCLQRSSPIDFHSTLFLFQKGDSPYPRIFLKLNDTVERGIHIALEVTTYS